MITTNSIGAWELSLSIKFNHEEHPVGVQFGGNNPEGSSCILFANC